MSNKPKHQSDGAQGSKKCSYVSIDVTQQELDQFIAVMISKCLKEKIQEMAKDAKQA